MSASTNRFVDRPGYNALWRWFGLSRASWLTLPRVLMHEMPDDWQAKMAALLDEFDETWNTDDLPAPRVTARRGTTSAKWPTWLLDYRRPDSDEIERRRAAAPSPEKQG